LQVLEAAIAKNAKAYCLWTHRLWVIDRLVEQGDSGVLAKELALCSKFLKLDERNFHCWSLPPNPSSVVPFPPSLLCSTTLFGVRAAAAIRNLERSILYLRFGPEVN
jgi:hypothetical protein